MFANCYNLKEIKFKEQTIAKKLQNIGNYIEIEEIHFNYLLIYILLFMIYILFIIYYNGIYKMIKIINIDNSSLYNIIFMNFIYPFCKNSFL